MTVQDTTQQARRAKRSGTPEAYDFRRPMTLAREHGRVLEMAFETYARQWGTLLTSRLRVVAAAQLESVELRTYDEYVRSLPPMTVMVLCTVEQGRSTAVLQLPLDSTMVWIDYLLGGPGLSIDLPDRELTEIELHLMQDLLRHALRDLTYAFAAICPLDVSIKSIQYNPQFVQAAAATEAVIVASFELTVADRTCPATLMLPADLLLTSLRAGDTLDSRSADEVAEHNAALDRLAEQVQEAPVLVSVRFRPLTIAARDIAGLGVGDVIPLRHAGDQPLDVVVGDVVLARAAIGSNGSRLACLVVTSEEKS
ncbi:MAG TPA: FliM/FliN family flagellar motor switch protein [Actinotalea sp.]